MKKIIMKIAALALVAIMAVPALGCFMVSAAEENPTTNKVIYFEDTKNWGRVFAYTWRVVEVTDENGQVKKVVEADTGFFGKECPMVGKVTRDGQTYNVFAYVLDENDEFIVFNQGFQHGQQTNKDIKISDHSWGDKIIVSLDKDNMPLIDHFFFPSILLPC